MFHPEKEFLPEKLPWPFEIETKAVMKKTTAARTALGELKGVAHTIPNKDILLNTLVLQEAKDSSAIENISTTHDELFRANLSNNSASSKETKEVLSYADALREGYKLVNDNGFLSANFIIKIQEKLEQNDAGFRKAPGTKLENDRTQETVYTPPQAYDTIVELMNNLESYINDDADGIDPLVRMAVIHYQFESIHPFYDGNGRTGRIMNMLYLTMRGLLDEPILYMSRYINQHKADYYRFLQAVRTDEAWEDWLLFMLDGVEQTAIETIRLINKIKALMDDYQERMKNELPRIYKKDLMESLFKHVYTKIPFVMRDTNVSEPTAISHLKQLVEKGFLTRREISTKNIIYVNEALYALFANQSK